MVTKLKKLATELAIAAVGTAGLLCGHAASAGLLTIQLDTGGGAPFPFNCADNTACDVNPNHNQVQVIFGVNGVPAIPGYVGQFAATFSNNPGSPGFNILDVTWSVSSVSPTGGVGLAGGPLTVTVSQTDFNQGPIGPGAILQSVCSGDITSVSVSCQEWVNESNTLFGLGPITPGLQGPFTAPFTNTKFSPPYNGTVPYSITDRLVFNLGSNATSTGDLRSITPVPEPATLALFGAALAGLGFARRRKQS